MPRVISCWDQRIWLSLYGSDTDYRDLNQITLTCSSVYGVLMSWWFIALWAKIKAVGYFVYSHLSLFSFSPTQKWNFKLVFSAELDKYHSFQHMVGLTEVRFIFINDHFLETLSPVVWCLCLIYLEIAMLWPMDRKRYQNESHTIQSVIDCGKARSRTFACECLLVMGAPII